MAKKNKRALGSLAIAVGAIVILFGSGAIYDPNQAQGILRALLTGMYVALLLVAGTFLWTAWVVWRDKK